MDDRLSLQRAFVSQETIEQQRREREEAWRKVHANEEPPPEAPYDPRPLYEKLQEQRKKREEAFQEATRLANLIHRLDDDEIDFLHAIKSEEETKEKAKQEEENMALDAFRRARAEMQTAELPQTNKTAATIITPPITHRGKQDRQRTLLGQIVVPKRKRSTTPTSPKEEEEKTTASKSRRLSKSDKEDTKEKQVESNPIVSLVAYDSDEDSDDDDDE